jgi:uncharacterized protein YjbI with pentapeptide repeats
LNGADLRNADLSDVTLSLANLSGADLTNADLSQAWLDGADLSGAIFNNASLPGAQLTGSGFRGAVLVNARNLAFFTLGSPTYDASTDFTGAWADGGFTPFDPVFAGWTLVPEPGTAVLLGLGLAGASAVTRRSV